MADIVQTGLEWLNGKRAVHRNITITYKRGSDNVSITTATHEYVRSRVSAQYGMSITEEREDFLFEAAKLILGGSTVLPKVGDVIEQVIDGTTHVYKVVRNDVEDGHYRFSDNLRKYLRVYTAYQGTS